MPEVALYRTARQDSKIRFRMFTFIARLEENKIVHKQKFFLSLILTRIDFAGSYPCSSRAERVFPTA